MTYRDMTFCRAPECIHFKACHRALTEKVEADAKALGLPIGEFVNPKQNYCYKTHESKTHSHN